MTEVPEHLLRRARERRAAATGGAAGDAGGGAESSSTAVEASAAATPAAAGGGGRAAISGSGAAAATPEPAYTGPVQRPAPRRRIPLWAFPVLVFLPLWAVLYSGAFGERKTAAEGPVARGQTVYATAGCSGCHGPTGGGGVGPSLANVTKTFPNFADHISWVETGSAPYKGKTYGNSGRTATGGMPAFKGNLSPADIIAVVCHERVDFGKQTPIPPECADTGATAAAGK